MMNHINAIAARTRQLGAAQAKVASDILRCHELLSAGVGKLAEIAKYAQGVEPLEWEALARQAERVIPFWYNVEINFASTSVARTQGVMTVTQEGYFLMTRLSCAWRPTIGANNGEFKPISSGNPVVAGAELQAAGEMADKFDFVFEYSEGAAQRRRQTNTIPGDLFLRQDGDFVLPTPDIFMPASVVTFSVTPTQAVDNTGVFTVTAWGMQCLNVLEAV